MFIALDMSVRQYASLTGLAPAIYGVDPSALINVSHTTTPTHVTPSINTSQDIVIREHGAGRFHLGDNGSRPTPDFPKKGVSGYIPGPRNKFFFFRSFFYEQLKAAGGPIPNQQIVSKMASAKWVTLSEIEKQPFIILAEKSKKEHKEKYPDYRKNRADRLKLAKISSAKISRAKASRAKTSRARSAQSAGTTSSSAVSSPASWDPPSQPPSPSSMMASQFSTISLDHTATVTPHLLLQQPGLYSNSEQSLGMHSNFGMTLDQVSDVGQYGTQTTQSRGVFDFLPSFSGGSGYNTLNDFHVMGNPFSFNSENAGSLMGMEDFIDYTSYDAEEEV